MRNLPFNGVALVSQKFRSDKYNPHWGTDYAIVHRTALVAMTAGRVIKTATGFNRNWIANTQSDPYKVVVLGKAVVRKLRTEDYGNLVKIDHGKGVTTLYAHLDEVCVNVGDTVKEGQLIGYSDNTGNSTGNHLHFEIRINDRVVDPETFDYSFEGLEGGVETKLYPLETTVEIVVPALYVRRGPSRSEPLSGSREIKKGDIIDVIGFVEGENIEGNNLWYKSAKGNYFWAGGTNKAHPELTLDGRKRNMTNEEREAKLHDFEVWKQGLDARRAELEVETAKNATEIADYEVKYAEFLATPVTESAEVPAEPVAEEAPVVEAVVEPVAEEVVETEEDKAQKAKLLEMYEWLKTTLGK